MLFIDQPNQAGFSYDVLTNGTLMAFDDDELDGAYMKPIIQNFTDERPLANLTAYPGTFASQEVSATQNSTASAARALWHFAQTWFFEFPGYKPKDNRISLWTESYGGHYGPGVFRFFQEQNNKISNGILNAEQAHYLHLDTLGIINGQVDLVVQGDVLPDFAYNNVSLASGPA
jgi:carboxypeptidase C (cathepsin A)